MAFFNILFPESCDKLAFFTVCSRPALYPLEQARSALVPAPRAGPKQAVKARNSEGLI